MFGIAISCFLFLDNDNPPLEVFEITSIILMSISSDRFCLRTLRQYRIHLLTYIEKGLYDYNTLIKRKSRLSEK